VQPGNFAWLTWQSCEPALVRNLTPRGNSGAYLNPSATGASVSVTTGPIANGNPFTLTDNITRNGCPGQCTRQVPIVACTQLLGVFKQVVCVGEDGTCAPFNDANLNEQSSASGVKLSGRDDLGESRMQEICMSGSTREREAAVFGLCASGAS